MAQFLKYVNEIITWLPLTIRRSEFLEFIVEICQAFFWSNL